MLFRFPQFIARNVAKYNVLFLRDFPLDPTSSGSGYGRDEPASVAAALPACSDVERGAVCGAPFWGITGVPTCVLWWCQCLVRSGGRSLLPVRGRAGAHMCRVCACV